MTGKPSITGDSAWSRALIWGLRYVLGLVWLTSGLAKWALPYAFLSEVYQYEMLSLLQGGLVAATLPLLEISLGMLLLAGWLVPAAAWLSVGLFAVFVGVKSLAVWSGLEISCGCFGSLLREPVGVMSVMITLALLCASGLLACMALRVNGAPPNVSSGTKPIAVS